MFKQNKGDDIMEKQSRWQSPIVWGCLGALLLMVLKNWGLLQFIGLTPDSFNELWTLVIAFLAALGVINRPDVKNKF